MSRFVVGKCTIPIEDFEFTSKGVYQLIVRGPTGEEAELFIEFEENAPKIKDSFCSCGKAGCSHFNAAKEFLLSRGRPLHTLFNESYLNFLFRYIAQQFGFGPLSGDNEVRIVEKDRLLFEARFPKPAFGLKSLLEKKRGVEEGSLYLFRFSDEETGDLSMGKAPFALSYELSVWIEIAKILFLEEEIIDISFDRTDRLPQYIFLSSPHAAVSIYIPKALWKPLLGFLRYKKLPFRVFDFSNTIIRSVEFREEERIFRIEEEPCRFLLGKETRVLDDLHFVPGQGFVMDRAFQFAGRIQISEEEIAPLLEKYEAIIGSYLTNTHISPDPIEVRYHLHFDAHKTLHIQKHLFHPGERTTHFYGKYAYIEHKGFFVTEGSLFAGREKLVRVEKFAAFFESNRSWIGGFDGFHIHLTKIALKYFYKVEKGKLTIDVMQDVLEENQQVIDLGPWFYVRGEGFFEKEETLFSEELPIVLEPASVGNFINKYQKQLEHVSGFFLEKSPVKEGGLVLNLVDDSHIDMHFELKFEDEELQSSCILYGSYGYLDKKGFFSIISYLPKELAVTEKEIPKAAWNIFFKYEFPTLTPFILSVDPRLELVENFDLVLNDIEMDKHAWDVDIDVRHRTGTIPFTTLVEGFSHRKKALITPIGRFNLEDEAFNWIIPFTSAPVREGRMRLSTLLLMQFFFIREVKPSKTMAPEKRELIEKILRFDVENLFEQPRPRGFKSKLRTYQAYGLRWLWFLYNLGLSGFLSDEMGLGKTHQAMGLIAAIRGGRKKEDRGPILIVCPTSVIYHWEELIKKYLPKMKMVIYHGTGRSSRRINKSAEIILTTYGILRGEEARFKKLHYELAVYDEVHIAKNHKSQIHKALSVMQAKMKLGVTGTPIENNILELKALFDLILPDYLPKHKIKEGEEDKKKLEEIRKLVRPFILRRRKEDVLLDLPEKIEEVLFVDLSAEQRKLYEEAEKKKEVLFSRPGEKDFTLHIFGLINELKQICNHPSLIHKDLHRCFQHESSKFQMFVEILEETLATGKKLVVFSHYLDMLSILRRYLEMNNIGYAEIIGATQDRKEQVAAFQNDPNVQVFLGSLGAAGLGIDLTAASVVVHFDRWWNPAKEDQATDRVHRIGQKRGIIVFKFVTKNTIEENIHALIESKKGLMRQILSYDEEQAIKKLTLEELIQLFEKH